MTQVDAVFAEVSAPGHAAQVQEGRRRLDAQRHPEEVQREAVEAALLAGGLLQGVAAEGVLLAPPQPQGQGLPGPVLVGVNLRVRPQPLHAHQDDGGGGGDTPARRQRRSQAALFYRGWDDAGRFGAAASQAGAGMCLETFSEFPQYGAVWCGICTKP